MPRMPEPIDPSIPADSRWDWYFTFPTSLIGATPLDKATERIGANLLALGYTLNGGKPDVALQQFDTVTTTLFLNGDDALDPTPFVTAGLLNKSSFEQARDLAASEMLAFAGLVEQSPIFGKTGRRPTADESNRALRHVIRWLEAQHTGLV